MFYYQGLTEQENADVIAWNVLYWQRVDQGGGSPGESFSFTNPTMNTHLFNPVRSARPTLELVGTVPEGYCDRMYEVGIPDDEIGARAALRDLMIYGEITTDVDADPWGSWEHLMLIMATPPDTGLQVIEQFGELTSVDLPLEEISGAAAAAALKLDLSPQTQTTIGQLITAGGLWASAAQSGDTPQWQALITGETSKAEQFRAKVDGYLSLAEVEGASTQVIQANFGLFGELPVVAVQLSDCYVLIDPTNGNLSGPFESDSPLDARGLLSFHADAYEAGKSVRYYNHAGCPIERADVQTPWTPTSPPGIIPGPFIPVMPSPVSPPGTLPGRPTPWVCTTLASGACECTTEYTYELPGGATCPLPRESTGRCLLRLRVTCTSAPGYGGACNGGPNTIPAPVPGPGGNPPPGVLPEPPSPATPPGTNPDFPTGGAGCTSTYWYWQFD